MHLKFKILEWNNTYKAVIKTKSYMPSDYKKLEIRFINIVSTGISMEKAMKDIEYHIEELDSAKCQHQPLH